MESDGIETRISRTYLNDAVPSESRDGDDNDDNGNEADEDEDEDEDGKTVTRSLADSTLKRFLRFPPTHVATSV